MALVAVHDLGQLNAPQGAGQYDDGKRLVVPDEGTWQVDASSGAILFTPDAALRSAPSPVSYCFADVDGNVSDAAMILMDPHGDFDSARKTQAAQTNAAFWQDFRTRMIDDKVTPLAPADLYAVTMATMTITGTLVSPGTHDPFPAAARDAAYAAWVKKGPSTADLYDACEAACQSLAGANPEGFDARYWRLRLMVELLARSLKTTS